MQSSKVEDEVTVDTSGDQVDESDISYVREQTKQKESSRNLNDSGHENKKGEGVKGAFVAYWEVDSICTYECF